jgi:hypothetical protein
VQYRAKGSFKYNLGKPKREPVLGQDDVHGYTEKPQAAYIEGTITDDADLDLANLVQMVSKTVTIELANGKVISLRDAVFTGDGEGSTEEGEITVRFDGKSAVEVA